LPARSVAALNGVLASLLAALYARDTYTAEHSERVSYVALLFASAVGVSELEREWIRLGALLHDVGKIGTPDNVLKNPGRLTEEQFTIMQRHPAIGRTILAAVEGMPNAVLEIVHFHHERVDGQGYPAGLKARQIPYGARLVAIADAWDAMTSARAYRPPLLWEDAVEEMVKGAGRQFDPDLTGLFLTRIVPRLAEEMENGWPFVTAISRTSST
jgi:putative nucleotidyltransferase with HDIG domain